MHPILKWSLITVGVLVVAASVGLSILAGSPKDAIGMVRYALPHMHRGSLQVGSDAPDATLVSLDGSTRFHLRERTKGRPLVLVFGSFTWPPFRRQVGDIAQIYNDYKDRADFLTIYVREAHPLDEWQMKSNEKDKDNVCYAQPKTLEQRVAIANDFTQRFKYSVPFGIDEMTNAANDAYAAWPERLYIIDEQGRISYKGGNGPFKYNPKEVHDWLANRFGEVKHPDAASSDKKT
jgi:peroxiredoxin